MVKIIMKRKKYLILSCILILLSLCLFGCNDTSTNNENNNSGSRTSIASNIETYSSNNEATQSAKEKIENAVSNPPTPIESDLAIFSTPLKGKAPGRLNNIQITCKTLNGTIIANGESFSFNKIIGEPTIAKGYQEADVIIEGKTEKAIGGGNCQVSSTLYNTVLATNGLEVLERHEHGKDVSYVPDGKDAAVSYGGLDFKFKNNTGHSIKIYASSDDINVTTRIVSTN